MGGNYYPQIKGIYGLVTQLLGGTSGFHPDTGTVASPPEVRTSCNRRKPASRTSDVAFREQGPWGGRGDCGKLAGGGKDMRKEDSSPLTTQIAAPARSVGLWRSVRCPPLLSILSAPAALLILNSHFYRGGISSALLKAANSCGPFSLTCLPHRSGQGRGSPL